MTTAAQGRLGPLVRLAPRAAQLLADRAATEGRLAVVLRGVASGHAVARLVADDPKAGPAGLIVVGEVAGCRVMADRDEIVFCPHEALTLVVGSAPGGRLSWLLTRPESTAERHDRVLCAPAAMPAM
jgi:hypothetical protein